MRIAFLIAAIALAVLIIVGIQYGSKWFGPDAVDSAGPAVTPEQPAARPPAPPKPAPAAEPEARTVVLPELDASDEFVLQQLAAFDLPPAWLDREDLLRRLAVVIDNAPRGELPRRQLRFLAPTGSFKVIRRGEGIFIDPASYARYDAYLDILEAVEPEALAQTIDLLAPLIAQGLAELGNQQAVFAQIDLAIARILSLQRLGDEVRLIQPEVLYQFADPRLEALSPLQKQALRMGPTNLARLQDYLRRFQAAYMTAPAGD